MRWQDLMAAKAEPVDFLLEPYIPRGGICFLWGETSIGKSPITWQMSAAVARGYGFFGLPVQKGRVLYIELDTPRDLIKRRICLLEDPPEDLDFLFMPPLSVPNVGGEDLDMIKAAASVGYDLVVINTLRKCHSLNDKEPQTVKVVYEWFQKMFPGAALLFVHHSKKTTFDSKGEISGKSRESFSGAQNWLNDAQVGMQLLYKRQHHGEASTNLELRHEKSQVGRQYRAFLLSLKEDGTNFRSPYYEELMKVYTILNESEHEGEKLTKEIALELGLSREPSQRRRALVESGRFPGLWLAPKD